MSRCFLFVIFGLFLLAIVYLPFSVPVKFNTPDENANYFFAKLFTETGQLKIIEPLEKLVDNAIHPRSINVLSGFLVPEGFWGLPLIYGALGRLFSINFLPYLTAVLTILSLPFYFLFFKRIFGDKIARLSLLLLLVNPVFWYNASRNFYHNLLFVNFLIVFLFLVVPDRSQTSGFSRSLTSMRYILAGISLGLVLLVRPSEILWLAVLVGVFFLHNLYKKNWAILGLLSVALPLVAMFYINNNLYGGFLHFGYSATESAVTESQTAVPQLSKLDLAQQLIMPFGFNPIGAVERFFDYGIAPIWWFVLLILVGAVVVVIKSWSSAEVEPHLKRGSTSARLPMAYLITWSIVSIHLIFYYGSFNAEFFTDPGHEFIAGIGSSYLRYWLPIFVFATPFAAISLQFLSRKRAMTAITMIAVVFLSARSVLWNGEESLLAIQKNLRQFNTISSIVMAKTPHSSVMIVPKWADRIYFPERRAIVDVEGKNVVKIIETLLEQEQSVFYLTGRGAIPLKSEELQENGLILERRFDLEEKGKMYQIIQN